METLTALPHQVRRNMDLLRDLDSSCSLSDEQLRGVCQKYLHQAEEKMMLLEIVYKEHSGQAGVRTLNREGIILPTTLELLDYVHDETMENEIRKLQDACLQKSEEKVAVARQSYEMVDAIVRRLDQDLEAMEKLLQVMIISN